MLLYITHIAYLKMYFFYTIEQSHCGERIDGKSELK